VSGSAGIELSQTLLELAGMGIGEEVDWMRQIRIDYLTAVDGTKMQLDAGLYLGESYITGIEFSYDLEGGEVWIGLPDMHDSLLFEKIEPADVQVSVPPYEQIVGILVEEKETVSLMIAIYCRKKHGCKELCSECAALDAYARQRSDKCPFMETKTFCSNCKVHCYKKDMREKIREVMRFSGPRMIIHHPVMAIRHVIESKKEKKRLETQ
jgi:hypothetical protein